MEQQNQFAIKTPADRISTLLSDLNIELRVCKDPVAREMLGKAYIELIHASHLIETNGYWRNTANV